MLVIAQSIKGHEFLYDYKTAHKVSANSAEKILKVLNNNNWRLKDNHVWYIHEVDEFDSAFIFANSQKFTIRKGIVKAVYN